MTSLDLHRERRLLPELQKQARRLGFADLAVTSAEVRGQKEKLADWLAKGYQGDMHWMARAGIARYRTGHLLPGAASALVVRMNYRPPHDRPAEVLRTPERAYIARYALGRDYHKVLRRRLRRLAEAMQEVVAPLLDERDARQLRFRALVDTAPLLEKPLAAQAGLGWIGKNTLLLTAEGSWFLLGLLLTNLRLPHTRNRPAEACGQCQACLSICPTQAFPAPYVLDARRCISYLTIENRRSIPEQLRPAIGNRVFGCDDCQLVCPWNRFARLSDEAEFRPRHGLDTAQLIALFGWTRVEFELRTRGSAIRRAGYFGWRRNLAVALGNAPPDPRARAALQAARGDAEPLLLEHIDWALREQAKPAADSPGWLAAVGAREAERQPLQLQG